MFKSLVIFVVSILAIMIGLVYSLERYVVNQTKIEKEFCNQQNGTLIITKDRLYCVSTANILYVK